MNKIGMIRKSASALIATISLSAIAIWWGCITTPQPMVTPPPIPIISTGSNLWITTNVWDDVVETLSNGTFHIHIEPGYETDLASIPNPLAYPAGLTHDSPSIRRGALDHDAAYSVLDPEGIGPITREEADAILESACLKDGTAPAKARAVRLAVSTWGWWVVMQHTPTSVTDARKLVTITKINKGTP